MIGWLRETPERVAQNLGALFDETDGWIEAAGPWGLLLIGAGVVVVVLLLAAVRWWMHKDTWG